jgi:ankyrin repeat protein
MLLDHGMAVDDHAERKITPLHVAAEENQSAVAELLLERGAELEAVQGNGYTPLTAATYMESTDVMALLKRHGAKCQPADFMGKGAYDECAAAGN